jgi:biopolymer transport protein ExbD
MELIPHDELKSPHSFNSAPMIDFFFLMLAMFAVLSVSRSALLDTDISLAELKPEKEATSIKSKAHIEPIHISVSSKGGYKWLTEFEEYPMASVTAIQDELSRQYKLGTLPQDKRLTEVLLHIDKQAPWEPIAQLIFGVREAGFDVRPIYTAED